METEFFRNLPEMPIGEARGGFLLHYAWDGAALRVTAERGSERRTARIDWAFGAGAQGVTPLVRDGDHFLEHRISYYPRAGRFDLTLGHQPGASKNAAAALGIDQPDETLSACLGCHSSLNGLKISAPGVDCARCHAGAQAHARSPGLKVTNPAKLDAKDEVALCASCHRLTPPGRPDDALNIRFQPLRLIMSRCYGAGSLRCGTCHSAHEDASQDPSHYRAACIACHRGQEAKGDCVKCHMPRSMPAPYLTFTDHLIRK